MSFRLGVRRSLLRAGLLAVAATGMMAVAPAIASHAPAVVSSAGAASFAHPASSCGNHPCVL